LAINGVKSAGGTNIAASTVVPGTLDPMFSIDITASDLWTNGTTFYEGPGTYLVNASGYDIWNANDGFRFIYVPLTNNVDVVVQVPFINNEDNWSKAGLMIRETLDPTDGGSRMYYNVTTALAAQKGLDGGAGVNTTSEGCREGTDIAAVGPPSAPQSFVPAYPNVWLRLTRVLTEAATTNDTIVGYYSTNDLNWTVLGSWSPNTDGSLTPFPSTVFVGMCTTAHTSTKTTTTLLTSTEYTNFGNYVVNINIATNPANVTVASGDTATFSVAATTASSITLSGVVQPNFTYQWFTNGGAVPGANQATLTIPDDLNLDEVTVAESGMKVYCEVSAIGHNTGTNTTSATLTVTANPEAPTVTSAFAEFDTDTSNAFVDVTFNEAMSTATLLNPANYTIAGNTVTGVRLFTNSLGIASSNEVIVSFSNMVTGAFSLGVTGVSSFSGTAIAASTKAAGVVDPLTSIDITSLTAGTTEISTNGTTYYQGDGNYEVLASGNDIWNASDGFRFVYETKTNGFAVVVQVPSMIPADTWSKAGLMVRETIDPDVGTSRYFDVITTAEATQIGLDGSAGRNSLSVDAREATDIASVSPAGYIGDGTIIPDFPNQWLLLARQIIGSNDFFSCYSSTDKTNWTFLSPFDPLILGSDTAYPSVVNVGMCAVAHVAPPNMDLVTVEFQNFGDYTDTNVTIVTSPVSQTIATAETATFTVAAKASVNAIFLNKATNGLVGYQWYTNGVPVPDAYSYSWTTPSSTPAMSNMSVYCAVFPIGGSPTGPGATNSKTATLDVYLNSTPVTVLNATGLLDSGGGGATGEFSGTNQTVDVTFSLPVTATALNISNYTIAGSVITNAHFFVNDEGAVSSTQVVLQLSNVLSGPFTLQIATNVADVSGVGLAAGTSVSAGIDPMTSMDLATAQCLTNGVTYFIAPGNYEVDAPGSDMWNASDGFRYVFQPVTNNFDIKVQVVEDLGADSWSKAGLMVRESIDPGTGTSRMIFWVTTPAAGTPILDGSTPENSLSMGGRFTTSGGAQETGTTWTGDGNALYAPHYPNVWLRMTRELTISGGLTNDLFTTYYSTNGSDWTKEATSSPTDTNNVNDLVNGTTAVAYPSVCYIGMAATAHYNTAANPGYRSTAIFNNYGPTSTVVTPTGPTLTATRASPTTVSVSWKPGGGTLYSSLVLTTNAASWSVVGTNNPSVVNITGGAQYFEIRE